MVIVSVRGGCDVVILSVRCEWLGCDAVIVSVSGEVGVTMV